MPQRLAGSTGRILDKVKGLPSLALADVCLHNNDKASTEQLWSPGDLREAETILHLFFINISMLDTTIQFSHNHIELSHQSY